MCNYYYEFPRELFLDFFFLLVHAHACFLSKTVLHNFICSIGGILQSKYMNML